MLKIYKNLKSPYISILLDYALRIIANIFQDLQNRRQLFRNFYLQFMLIKENQNFYLPVVLLFSWAFCILPARILFLPTSAKWKYCSVTTDVWLLRQATGEFSYYMYGLRIEWSSFSPTVSSQYIPSNKFHSTHFSTHVGYVPLSFDFIFTSI